MKIELPRCCETWTEYRGGWPQGKKQCKRNGRYEHEGKHYCKQHHPPTRKAKDAASLDAYNAKCEVERKQRRIERAAPDLLDACKMTLGNVVMLDDNPLKIAIKAAIAKAEGRDEG